MTTRQTTISDAAVEPTASPAQREPVLVRAGQKRSRTYSFLGAGVSGSCLVGAEQTGGVFSVFEIAAEPGSCVPPHFHRAEEETIYMLEGNFEIQRGNQVVEMAAGMALHGPRGVVHGFRCVGEQPGRGLIITTPGGFENFLAELNAAGSELASPGEAPFARIGALMSKYGMEPGPEPPEPTELGNLAPSRFIGLGNYRGHVLASADETCGALILANLEVDPQGGPQPHLHRREDAAIYILEGCFTVMLGEHIIEAGPGDFVFVPRGAVHWWSNTGDIPAYALVLIAPAENFQEFTLKMETLVAQAGEDVSPEQTDPALREEIAKLYQRHCIEPVTPVRIIK